MHGLSESPPMPQPPGRALRGFSFCSAPIRAVSAPGLRMFFKASTALKRTTGASESKALSNNLKDSEASIAPNDLDALMRTEGSGSSIARPASGSNALASILLPKNIAAFWRTTESSSCRCAISCRVISGSRILEIAFSASTRTSGSCS